jgi:hypothetical protein
MTTTAPGPNPLDCPERLPFDEVDNLRNLPPSEKVTRLRELGRCVASGTSDEIVAHALAEVARESTGSETQSAWLTYIAASQAGDFFSVLLKWLQDGDEDQRAEIVGVLAWNHSSKTNEALLRLIREDQSGRVRSRALMLLVRRGTLGKWEPRADLLDLAQDSDWRPVTRREYLKLIGHP